MLKAELQHRTTRPPHRSTFKVFLCKRDEDRLALIAAKVAAAAAEAGIEYPSPWNVYCDVVNVAIIKQLPELEKMDARTLLAMVSRLTKLETA